MKYDFVGVNVKESAEKDTAVQIKKSPALQSFKSMMKRFYLFLGLSVM